MSDVEDFALLVLAAAAAITAAVLSSPISERIRVPAPAIFLLAAALASDVVPALGQLSVTTVQRVVTVALAIILFDGGMHIGWQRFREAAGPVIWVGVAGTFVTAAALAVLAHALFGLDWWPALLLGTALAPTDPVVVFSVLGRREVAGRSGTILEGESGANDPVGIALMASLLTAGQTAGLDAAGSIAGEFLLQLAVGAAVGVAGGALLVGFMRRVPLPSEGLYPLRVLAAAMVIYGAATVAHGSGFLAVFIAGILAGDARAPYKGEIERFHAALASLAEIVAFIVLGLTVGLHTLPDGGAWRIGLALAVLLTFVVRPLLVGLLLLPVRLTWGERLFVLWAGLKGAVPILLGTFLLAAGVPDASRLYAVVFVVVAFSVVVQGGLVPAVAARLGVPMRIVEPEPWSLGVRFRHEPRGLRRHVVAAGSPADGCMIGDLDLGEDVWISLVIRHGQLVPVQGSTALRAGDEILALTDPQRAPDLAPLFTAPRPGTRDADPTPS
ncbi:MAG TPA: potassium/proton antiporter [Actinomycetes bacterium]|jgi:cell volume regulation protein A|nr:potassium/proton antiporter [Actinomycetes bacterium]